MYFNYHAKIKKLILENHLKDIIYAQKFNNISPAIVFLFDNNKPMPIREYRFQEYLLFLSETCEKTSKYKKLLCKYINHINHNCNNK